MTVTVIQTVIGVLVMASKVLERWLEELEFEGRFEIIQFIPLQRSARIPRRVL